MKLVECIPNFSEGRRQHVIEAIVDSIRSVPGIKVLDLHTDADHNRSVVTFVGAPDAVLQAAFSAIAQAAAHIDMDAHSGEHPRIGAADVVPFVPLAGMTMDECVAMARQLGERVARELDIPVFLYEAAATRPDRQNLANLRKGEYEGLKAEIATNPDRQPDFGPALLGKAGAVVIGARPPLIAYNIYLTTDDVEIAKRIARDVRFSGGGLAYLKALGMLVKGRAQISMNLTDHTQTPLARVVEMIRREAQRYGVGIHHAELVGLIPQSALIDAARWYLQLDEFESDQILETRLYAAMMQEQRDIVERLSQRMSSGLGAAAYNGAMSSALVGMAARVTLGRRKYADVAARMADIATESDLLRQSFEKMESLDSRISANLRDALQLDSATRAPAAEQAAQRVIDLALDMVRALVRTLEMAVTITEEGTSSAAADLSAAAAMLNAGVQSCRAAVRANLSRLLDSQTADDYMSALNRLEQDVQSLHERFARATHERSGIIL